MRISALDFLYPLVEKLFKIQFKRRVTFFMWQRALILRSLNDCVFSLGVEGRVLETHRWIF